MGEEAVEKNSTTVEKKPKKLSVSKVLKSMVMLLIITYVLSVLFGRRSGAVTTAKLMSWSVDNAYVTGDKSKLLFRNPVNLLMKGSIGGSGFLRKIWEVEIFRSTPHTDLYVGDVDGDGVNEVVSNYDNRLVVIDGGNPSYITLPYNPPYYFVDVYGLYDVNDDGKMEILLLLHYQMSELGFAFVDHQGNVVVERTGLKTNVMNVYDVVFTDVGGSKAVVFMHESGISAYNLDGQLIYDVEVSISGYEFTRMAIADVNGDDVPELVFTGGSGVYVYRLSDGSEISYKFLGYDVVSLSVGDVDGDGVNEIVTSGLMDDTGKDEWVVLKGNEIVWRAEAMGGNTIDLQAIIADVDGDGSNEVITYESTYLVCRSKTGDVKWYLDLGDYVYRAACAGDLNGDGKLEIVVMTYDTLYIVSGDGLVISYEVLDEGNGYYTLTGVSPVVDDVDGDGMLEIVVDYMVYIPDTGTDIYKAVAYE